ncbi:glycosyltransferase family 2 protein, partial [Calocera viscosa TUFC12733]
SSHASLALSVVIPAYNERLRLPPMLDEAVPYLEAHHSPLAFQAGAEDHPVGQKGYEILIVDDGSSDGTTATALAYAEEHPAVPIRVITLAKNRGKGGAVKHGVLHARGARILFVDADGATRFEDLRRVWKECARLEHVAGGYAAVVGSRAHLVGTDAVVKRSFIRNILMHCLHTILRTLGVGHIQDTQCGFKLFSRACAQLVFPAQHVTHWMFDVELLILCSMLRIPVTEVPVGWHEVSGSKINLVWDSIGMLKDLVVVRANYAIGRW